MFDVFKEDVDRLLSYNTKQQVKILDRWLGIFFLFLQLIIVAYIVGYVFIYDEGYLEYEQAKGVAVTHIRGDVAVTSSGTTKTRSFAADEINYPGLENGNVFIATKMQIQKQKRGICADVLRPCATNAECASAEGAHCVEDGHCHEPSWCTIEHEQPEVYKLPTQNSQIWVKLAIQFWRLNRDKVFTTNMKTPIPYPDEGHNTYSVRELLLLCNPPVRYEEISELGAAIDLLFFWSCNVDRDDCVPQINARRIDALLDENHIGFKFSYPVYDVNDDNVRRLHSVRGIRFYVRSIGRGRKVSIAAIIFKISTGIALLVLAPILVDLLMLKCFAHAKKYNARKYEYSQDFGDYFEELQKRGGLADVQEEDENEHDAEELAWRRRMDEEDD
eukprot:GEMP01020594.1.p1 GENE.GEMP01020594.1~~GEMP01020594.1.p1  ORF type:complete len:388 (+),score=100.94 GEMP01020594.1:210-1373(+)